MQLFGKPLFTLSSKTIYYSSVGHVMSDGGKLHVMLLRDTWCQSEASRTSCYCGTRGVSRRQAARHATAGDVVSDGGKPHVMLLWDTWSQTEASSSTSSSRSASALLLLALQHSYISPDDTSISHPQYIHIYPPFNLVTFFSINFETSTQSNNPKLQLIQNTACI